MLSRSPIVSVQPFFHAATADELCEIIETRLNAKVVGIAGQAESPAHAALASRCLLPRSELWFCSYRCPLTLRIPDSDYVRVQFRVSGTGSTRIGRRSVAITESQACISAGAAEIDFGVDLQQVIWRIGIPQIIGAMSTLLDQPVTKVPQFDPQLDLALPSSRAMLGILQLVLQNLQNGSSAGSPLLLAEFEQALIVSFLCSSSHSLRDQLDRRTAAPAPWQVRRAENYIEANWDQPITIQAIAEATGASARSIFRAFQRHRGFSPLDFVKRVRLNKAHEMLDRGAPSANVTGVAFACGYNDLAHFSRDFLAAYGQRPSDLLARQRSSAAGRTAA